MMRLTVPLRYAIGDSVSAAPEWPNLGENDGQVWGICTWKPERLLVVVKYELWENVESLVVL